LTDAIHKKPILYCEGVVVPANFRPRLMVVARFDPDGRWTADIVSAVGEAWERPAEITKVVEGVEIFGERVFEEIIRPPYEWKLDVDEVVTLLPVRRGPKGVNFEIHTGLELERLGRKAALDLHNSGRLIDHLEKILKREVGRAPKDEKTLPRVI